jgi:predicted CXXCH cytochrome family protein
MALVIGLAGVACVDEKIVFRDRELFTEPPAGAADFIGYTDSEAKLTVCGNCHVNNQSEWVGTAHADAWETLAGSGHAQASCEGCHTISSKGNPTSGNVGWDATRDERYHDVQCESCHGPGLTHVTNPRATNIPLAPMVVDTALTRGCGECHNGTHHPFVEEWKQSAHSSVRSAPVGRAQCEICHVGESVLAAWGVTSNFTEKDSLTRNASASLPITCGVCHDPHAKNGDGQLRFPIDVPDEGTNLCMKCHNRRSVPDVTSSSGPHAPEGPTVLGTAGWWPPNLESPRGTLISTHGSEANPRLCATCHINRFTVTNPTTGAFQFQATGHLFDAVPCLNSQGLPTRGDCSVTSRSFKGCTGAGCHATETVARSAFVAAEGRLELLTDALDEVVLQVPASEFNTSDGKYTTGEGAKFNLALARAGGSIIHNPFMIEALITSSIKQIEIDYGISAPPGLSLDNELQKRSQLR